MCKVLKFDLNSQALNWEQGEREYSQNVKKMEAEINSWLSNGWKLSNTVYDSNYKNVLVFLVK